MTFREFIFNCKETLSTWKGMTATEQAIMIGMYVEYHGNEKNVLQFLDSVKK